MSSPLALSLIALVVLMTGVFVVGVRGPRGAPGDRRRWTLLALAVAVGYLGVSGTLAATGALADLDARPPLAPILALTLGAVTVRLAFSRLGDRLLAWPLAVLVALQAFRVLVQWWLAAAHEAGVVPIEMTARGYNVDDVTGLTAVVVGVVLWRTSPSRWLVLIWNVIGTALLGVVIVLSILSASGAMDTTPRLTLPASWPGVWIPTWLVQLALLGHLLVFRALARRSPAPRRPPSL